MQESTWTLSRIVGVVAAFGILLGSSAIFVSTFNPKYGAILLTISGVIASMTGRIIPGGATVSK